jgi:hypothetical protein
MYKKPTGVISFGDQPMATTGKPQFAALSTGAGALATAAAAAAR